MVSFLPLFAELVNASFTVPPSRLPGGATGRKRRQRAVPTNDELLYDPDEDDRDQAWVDARRRRYGARESAAQVFNETFVVLRFTFFPPRRRLQVSQREATGRRVSTATAPGPASGEQRRRPQLPRLHDHALPGLPEVRREH